MNSPAIQRMMKMGVFLTAAGNHLAAWRAPDVKADFATDVRSYIECARVAEEACMDMIFLADILGVSAADLRTGGKTSRVAAAEPVTMLAGIATATSRIGLVGTASTTFNEPFNVARQFASLDHISGGRAGWNMVTSASDAEAANFTSSGIPSPAQRYERGREFLDVVLGLWGCFDHDAIVLDKGAGQYFDPAKVRALNHAGHHFSVRGPINMPGTPQRRPIIVQAGSSATGMAVAAKYADVVFTAQPTLDSGKAFYQELKQLVANAGRNPDHVLVMPGFSPVVGKTHEEALLKFNALQDLLSPDEGVAQLSNLIGMDLSVYDLDGPVPELPDHDARTSRQALLVESARRDNLTIRQLYKKAVGTRGHNLVVGTPDMIADALAQWFDGAADGFNIMPLTLPGGLSDFTRNVIPVLQERGLFRTQYESSTLRGNLGLPLPHA